MGSWGITMRQSDYGLDLLGTIVNTRLKTVDFQLLLSLIMLPLPVTEGT